MPHTANRKYDDKDKGLEWETYASEEHSHQETGGVLDEVMQTSVRPVEAPKSTIVCKDDNWRILIPADRFKYVHVGPEVARLLPHNL
jgi:hypothetical protein